MYFIEENKILGNHDQIIYWEEIIYKKYYDNQIEIYLIKKEFKTYLNIGKRTKILINENLYYEINLKDIILYGENKIQNFNKKLLLYFYFKDKNYDIKDGGIFSVDYLVKKNKNIHSDYGIIIDNNFIMNDLISYMRILSNVKKQLIIAQIKDIELTEIRSIIKNISEYISILIFER